MHKSIVYRLLLQLFLLLILYFVCRVVFIYANLSAFKLHTAGQWLQVLIGGIRFDLAAIFYTNAFFIILSLLPFSFTQSKKWQTGLKILFITVNLFCLLLNCNDIAYFQFIQKRMQFEAFKFLAAGKGNEFVNLIPGYLKYFWWLFVFFILCSWLLIKFYNRIQKKQSPVHFTLAQTAVHTLVLCLGFGISVLGLRGGFQGELLNISHASQMTSVENMPAIINTPFSIIKSINNTALKPVHYFPDEEIGNCFNGIHQPEKKDSMIKPNIVIIMLESLSKKYVGLFNKEMKTPFMDSIFSEGLLCTNAFANAKISIQGVPAVLSSIPSWQDDYFVLSSYGTNKISSFANLLKPKGYTTLFYHGGRNGSMALDTYSSLAGFDTYKGMNQYNNRNDYDGNWGIWDEPYLQYMAKDLSSLKQPFISAVLTVSSHPPFSIPEKYKPVFKEDHDPMVRCVQYLDHALAEFFKTAKQQPWFSNTLFVFTADHTAHNLAESTTTPLDTYSIPIVFYKPDGSMKGIHSPIVSQVDILPTVFHLINYPDPYFSIGRNIFNSGCDAYTINYKAGIYQYFDSAYCYQFNGSRAVGLYNTQSDKTLLNNVLNDTILPVVKTIDSNLKKMIQTFNNSMLQNKMYLR